MQRDRIEGGDRLKVAMRRAAGAHIVLGMDLEEAERRAFAMIAA
jgi:hypothetical protein